MLSFASARIAHNLSAIVTHQMNKRLYTELTRLKFLGPAHLSPGKFIVDQDPLDFDDEDLALEPPYIIIGRVLPNSEIFNQSAFQIELKVSAKHPYDPPEVKIRTPIYHPNIAKDGELLLTVSTIPHFFVCRWHLY